ncbi:MAG TPA: chemotaxis response regulator protein-glutamate methylesterase [Bryobacteraceae bacterium]|nr:chemotaxis response regulator protein-glutamate methylesterase [Bryobacteraceae bacterium]
MPIRVLIVDDSALVRKMLSQCLSGLPDIDVVGTAPDAYVARDKILQLEPDVVTLDIEMPRMDGISFLRKLQRHHPMPVIVISSVARESCRASLEALYAGAVDVLVKPSGSYSVGDWRTKLADKVRAAAMARVKAHHAEAQQGQEEAPVASVVKPAGSGGYSANALIAIGASTGGTEAIRSILRRMPANSPPIVIAQHIPPVFSMEFARGLDKICPLEVKEAVDQDEARPGRVLVAPGDAHLVVKKIGSRYRVAVLDGPPVEYHKPSINVLFKSVAQAAGHSAVGVLLTGMGSDGADGLLQIRQAGAVTIAQDEASCVVFGMPKEAIARGAAAYVAGLNQIPEVMESALRVCA